MRLTTMLFVCSAAAGCVTVEHRPRHDGVDAGTTTRTCDTVQSVPGDLTVSGTTAFASVPSTCWSLAGKLSITGASVTTLAKLGDLRAVKDLEIGGTKLTRIDVAAPFDVTGDVYIHDNDALTDLANVAPAGAIAGLRIVNNAALTSVGGLGHATSVTGAVAITSNAKLTAFDLSAVTRIDGPLTIANNAALASTRLSALTSVHALTVQSNAALTSLGSLGALKFVHGDLVIDGNAKLAGLADAMTTAIETIDGALTITNNGALATIGQLGHTGLALSITVTGNAALPYCAAREIGCCVNHQGYATIQNNQNDSCGTHSWCWNNGCPFAY